MFVLKLLSKLFKALGSSASPNQVAWGFTLGAIPGLTPLWSPHNLAVLLLILVLPVNTAAALFALAACSVFAWALDPIFHTIGFAVLARIQVLTPFWTDLYNAAVAPFTGFNNTVTMGSFLVALVLIAPGFFFFRWAVMRYRSTVADRIRKWRIIQVLKGSSLVRLYLKVHGGEV